MKAGYINRPFVVLYASLTMVGAVAQAQPRYQPIYECIDASGKSSFSFGTCAARSADRAAVRQLKHEPRPTPGNRAEIKERWELDEEQLKGFEMDCANANEFSCEVLRHYRYETPATMDLKTGRAVEKACFKGDKASCEALVTREKGWKKLMRDCANGNEKMCKRLSNVSQ